ncbi:hypothetical protein [Brevibacillus borstelensis]|uniref:hypothetical protein n=1 Tax=Brevibacillus borstelensis TaxID=45462 RepID=UPI0030C50C67
MTPVVLVDKLIKRIRLAVSHFRLQTDIEDAPWRAPQVVGGFLNSKRPATEDGTLRGLDPVPLFPYVNVRYLEDDGNKAIVKIIAGAYSTDGQSGWRDCMNVLIRIKQALQEQQFFGAFSIDPVMKTQMPEEQASPEWTASLTLSVTIPQTLIERTDVTDGIT